MKSKETRERTPGDRIVVVGLNQFDDGLLWWTATITIIPTSRGRPWRKRNHRKTSATVLTLPNASKRIRPTRSRLAIAKALGIAREQNLPLYRTTQYRDANGTELQVFEELFCPEL